MGPNTKEATSRNGSLGGDGDVLSNPDIVKYWLAKGAIDIGAEGYDRCYGSGRSTRCAP